MFNIKDGPIEVYLFTKYGAINDAKLISDGCIAGLKKSSLSGNLKEGLSINHNYKQNEYKEMLFLQRYNLVEQLSSRLNPFYGVRDAFDLERFNLIYQLKNFVLIFF
jgi:NifU-like protein involved in Fe-S cluster formation